MIYTEPLLAKFTPTEASEENAAPRFRMVANAGSVMTFGDQRIAIDVDGVFARNDGETIPILYGHDFANGVGHSTHIESQDGELVVEGVVSRKTKYAEDFVQSSRLGFPWQASVGGYILDAIELKENEELDLHGRRISGPCTVATKFELYEVSVVEYGADDQTESKVIGQKGLDLMDTIKQDEPVVDVNAAATFDVEAYRAAAAAETERVAEIRARSQGNDEALQAQAIREGWTPDRFELEALRAARPSAPAVHTPSANVDGKALEVAAIRAAGFQPNESRYEDRTLTAADKLRDVDFLEFCELATHAQQYSFRKSPYSKVCAALSTQNLGSILTNTADAILLNGFDAIDTSWRKVFKISTVSDYKTAERWRLTSNFKLKEVADGAQFKHAEVEDEKFEIESKLWGTQFTLGEKAIVNGDALGVLGELLRQVIYGANDAINEQVWSLFLNPTTCSDGKAFYHADHGSLLTGKTLNLANLSAARAAFMTRKRAKSNDQPLGIAPNLLVVPTSLEDEALMLTKATLLNNGATGATPADFNPNANRFQVVGVPFIEYATFGANASASTWYLLADPRRLAAFEIAFLYGQEAPKIRQDQLKIGTAGIEFDARLSFGVAQEDCRGAMKITA